MVLSMEVREDARGVLLLYHTWIDLLVVILVVVVILITRHVVLE